MMENKQLVLELEAQNNKLSDRVEVSSREEVTISNIVSHHPLLWLTTDARATNPYS